MGAPISVSQKFRVPFFKKMPKPALRVIFDTNVFSPDTFEMLEKSPIRKLCASGRLVAIYGHVFLEETLRAYGVTDRREDLVKRWLPFIADTVDRFCEDFVVIWHRELVEGGCG